jgi:hypothetical protein
MGRTPLQLLRCAIAASLLCVGLCQGNSPTNCTTPFAPACAVTPGALFVVNGSTAIPIAGSGYAYFVFAVRWLPAAAPTVDGVALLHATVYM